MKSLLPPMSDLQSKEHTSVFASTHNMDMEKVDWSCSGTQVGGFKFKMLRCEIDFLLDIRKLWYIICLNANISQRPD